MEVDIKKAELLDWLKNVEDQKVLQQIDAIKNHESKNEAFDFDDEWKKGYTVEEAKAESIRRINKWWGRKK